MDIYIHVYSFIRDLFVYVPRFLNFRENLFTQIRKITDHLRKHFDNSKASFLLLNKLIFDKKWVFYRENLHAKLLF